MNSKNNSFKRVAAGALAVLTVAAYTAPVANVGGLLNSSILVASAQDAEISSASSTAWTNATLGIGDFFDGNAEFHKADQNKDVFKVVIPNTFTVVKVKDASKTTYDALIDEANRDTFTQGNLTELANVTDIQYIAKKANTTDAKALKITCAAGTYVAYPKDDAATKYVSVKNVVKGDAVKDGEAIVGYNYTITFELKDNTVAGYDFDVSDVADYLTKVVYTYAGNNKVVTNEGTAAQAMTTFKAAIKTDVTIVSTAILGGDYADYKPVYSDGTYTYTFKAVDDKIINVKPVAIRFYDDGDTNSVASTVKVIKPTDTKEATYTTLTRVDGQVDADNSGDYPIYEGSTVTVVSDKPFTIADGAIKSQKTDGTFETQDVVGKYVDGAFKATFVVAGNLGVKTTAMPQNLTYTVSGAKVTADATVNNEKIVDNAAVASITATSKVPVYADADKTVIKKDSDNNNVYTETALASGASISYNKDKNAFIELDFDIDKNLIGSGAVTGGNNLKYKVVATLNGNDSAKKTVYTVTYDDMGTKKVTKAVGTGAAENVDEFNGVDIAYLDIDDTGFKFGVQDAGTYKFDLYVWGTDNADNAKIATTSFTVKPATDVAESDITLRGFYKDKLGSDNDEAAIDGATYYAVYNAYKENPTEENKTKFNAFIKANALAVTKNSSGIYEVDSKAELLKNNTVTIIAELADFTPVEVSGTKTNGNQVDVNNASLVITADNYDVDPIAIKWKLVEQAVEDAILFDVKNATFVNRQGAAATQGDYSTTLFIPAQQDTLESIVKKYLTSTNGIDVSNVSFKYTVGEALTEGIVDIDALTNGLPTFVTSGNNYDPEKKRDTQIYYIYASVGSLETATPLAVVQSDETANEQIETILTKREYTYGETITIDDIAFVKVNKDTVIDGLKVKGNGVVFDNTKIAIANNDETDETAKIYYKINPYKADGTVDTGKRIENSTAADGLLPGRYQVTVRATDKAVDANGYDVVDKAKDEQNQRVFDITVAKKQITADMFPEIQVPIVSKIAKLTDAQFAVGAVNSLAPTGVGNVKFTVKIDGGDSSATKVGDYTVKLVPYGDSTDLYTGSCEVQWRAVTTDDPIKVGTQKINVALTTENDNIYESKGVVYIHSDVQLKKEDKTNLTSAEFDALNAVEYGFVYDKPSTGGILKDVTDEDEAIKYLQLGICPNADTINNKKSDKTVAGINSKVESIDDYIWVRPYIKLADGRVQYGTPKRLDFTTVANAVIKPELAQPELVQKNDGIYYYAYASKVTKDQAGYRTATPKAFGVVISRKDNYADKTQDLKDGVTDYNDDEKTDINDVMYAIMNGKYVDTTVYDSKQLAYYNELKKNYNLTLENADVSSKAVANNKNYSEDECGTLVRITDSLSRLYVRTYVDFGNGLVVYSDVKTVENASDTLKDYFTLDTAEKTEGTKYYMTAKRDATPDPKPAHATVNTLKGVPQTFQEIKYNEDDVTEFGLIIDKNGVVQSDKDADHNFVLGGNFLNVKAKDPKVTSVANTTADQIWFAAVTTVPTEINNKATAISARGYIVYKGITIYGKIVSTYDALG